MRRILELLRFVRSARTRDTNVGRTQLHEPTRTAVSDESGASLHDGTLHRAEIVAARKRARWQPPDTDGPEFGGLIEPDTVYRRGLMPEPYRPSSEPEPEVDRTSMSEIDRALDEESSRTARPGPFDDRRD